VAELDAESGWDDPSAPQPPGSVLATIRAGLDRARLDRETAGTVIQAWKSWTDTDTEHAPLETKHSDEGVWEPIDLPGIRVKRLGVDKDRRMVTMLVRMEAGAVYPPHRHAAVEECFVIEGDLLVGETVMHAGDYQRAAAGSLHPLQLTQAGCTLLITSSQDDELVA
jgi:anti-sigma factor ChrR (cupin superfamily)